MNRLYKFSALFFSILLASLPVSGQTKKSVSGSDEIKSAIKNKKNGQKETGQKKVENPVVFNEDFQIGEELFSLNEPEKAIPYLEKALEVENINPAIYIYLGVAYYQTGEYNKSLAVCVKGLAKENTDHKVLAYNAGNSCYAMGNYLRADASYAIAIREDEKYAPAVLNRANAQLKLDHLEDSKNNYIRYLELDPESAQRERIELLIKLLEQEIELRAKQRPELINPDEFVENEKMEVGEIPEKVEVELPVYAEETKDLPERVSFDDSVAPEIPEEQLEIIAEENEVLADEMAPALPVEVVDVVTGEKIRETAPALPVTEDQKEEIKTAEISEKISGPEDEIPEEKPVAAEKTQEEIVDKNTLAVNDYEKEAREAQKLEKERLEAEKAAKEKAELERQKLLKQIEKEQQAASVIKVDDDDAVTAVEPAEVPKKVEVKENADGTVDIAIPTLSFKVNSYELTASASNDSTIKKVYEILSDEKYASFNVTITGYVNPDGEEWTIEEKTLALNRAQSVKNRLVAMGVSKNRVVAKNGDGKTDNKEYNRRVEFLLSKNDSLNNAK